MRIDVLGCGGFETTTEFVHIVTSPSPVCDSPMGIDDGRLPIQSIVVSSSKSGYGPDALRLSAPSAWKPLTSTSFEFIIVDFLEPRNITGLETKGAPQGNDVSSLVPESWVETYRILYSRDKINWSPILDTVSQKEKVFLGNFDGDSSRQNWFERPVHTRYLKIVPVTWRHEIAMKLEIFGCYEPYPTTTPPALITTPVLPCETCPGVTEPEKCTCGIGKWWSGENCVERSECPCVEGGLFYEVGSVFNKETCEECVCRMNGISSCSPKSCASCPTGLRSVLRSTCKCMCLPCETGTLLCPTSGVCIPEGAWCNGIQDCPDDESNCIAPVEETKTVCNATCPPNYAIIFPTEQNEVEIFEPKTKTKSVKHGAKGVKHTKTAKRPVKTVFPPTCPPYDCVPMPTAPPTECPQPSCPINFNIVKTQIEIVDACPRYSCKPPPVKAKCDISGQAFSTFDGVEYKYSICDHVLAMDISSGDWNVSAFKTCRVVAPCEINVVINHHDRNIILASGPILQIDGFDYTLDQINVINSKSKDFNISRVGDSWLFTSNVYDFKVIFFGNGNIQIEVDGDDKGHISGLCGLYNGLPADDKTRPDGKLGTSTEDFGNSWKTPAAADCDTTVCPVELQEEALHICLAVKKPPFSTCGDAIDLSKYISKCMDSVCECLKTNRTQEECRCNSLLDFVTTCREKYITKDLAGWRLSHDCSVDCPAGMTHYDCFPYSCEPSCEQLECVSPSTSNCFSGCFCSEGTVRRGDTCVKASECRDCELITQIINV